MNNFVKSEEVYIRTTDWWNDNFLKDGSKLDGLFVIDLNNISTWYGLEYVQLKLYINEQQKLARVAVWGTNNDGMQKDFIYDQYAKAITLYDELNNKKIITKQLLSDRGFKIIT